MARTTISKAMRQKVYDKYNGHCAYCGCDLAYKDMQVDHIDPVYFSEYHNLPVDDSLENYNPACRQCNFYKSTFTLEQFRIRLTGVLIPNLRKSFDYRLAQKYGLIQEQIEPVTFYFEKVGNE